MNNNTQFDIDVEAEIHKLSAKRFTSAQGWAVELLQYCLSRQPSRIDIFSNRRRLDIRVHSGTLQSDTVATLQQMLSPHLPHPERHRAILALETSGDFGIISAFALRPSRVVIDTGVDIFSLDRHGPRLKRGQTETATGVSIRITSRRRHSRSEQHRLRDAARYATVPVWLNGHRISRGPSLDDCLLEQPFERPGIRGIIGIPMTGDSVKTIFLKHGACVAVRYHASLGGLVYHAIADVDTATDDPYLHAEIRHVARQFYASLGRLANDRAPHVRRRIATLLIERYRHTRCEDALSEFAGFELLNGNLVTFRDACNTIRQRRCFAVSDRRATARLYTAGRQVFVLSALQRRLLERETQTVLATPPAMGANAAAHLAADGPPTIIQKLTNRPRRHNQ